MNQKNEFLKKYSNESADDLGVQTASSEKFRLIKKMIERDNNLLNISWLCETAGVSRSGESFFGHMEDEIHLERCNTFADLKYEIDDYMDYYNNDRY